MAATPYIISVPSPDSMPSRTLRDGVSAMAINAGSTADVIAMAKAQFDGDVDVMWANADIAAIVAATTMSGWGFRLRVISPAGVQVFDETVEADGTNTDFVAATKTLTFTPGAIADDKVQVGTIYYQFAADPTTGTPTGAVGSPFLVDVGADDAGSLVNLRKAINLTGVAGVDYAAETIINPTVTSPSTDATHLVATAKTAGSAGNSIAVGVTATGGADGLSWGGSTLAGGVGATDLISSLALKMVAALNDSGDIAGAAWDDSNQTLTVADTGDVLGDHQVYAFFIPVGADRTELKGISAMIVSTVDAGAASDALELVLETDAYTIPKVASLLGATV